MIARITLNLMTPNTYEPDNDELLDYQKLSGIEKTKFNQQVALKKFCVAVSHLDFMPAQGYIRIRIIMA